MGSSALCEGMSGDVWPVFRHSMHETWRFRFDGVHIFCYVNRRIE